MLLQLGRAAEAEAPLRKAVAIAPAHPAVRMNLAQWLTQQGNLDEALQVVEGVVADEPNRHWAWERLGELKARLRRFSEAADHFGRAVQLQPQDPSLLFKLAQANFDSGRRADAARVLDAARMLAPGNTAIFRLQADLHEAAADWAALEREAVAWRNAAPEDPAPWRALAKAQLQSGYPRLAMQSHQRAFELGGRSAEWLAVYGRVVPARARPRRRRGRVRGSREARPEERRHALGRGHPEDVEGRLRRRPRVLPPGARFEPGRCHRAQDAGRPLDNRLPAEDLAALRAVAEAADTKLVDRITA